jgi:hypothetical protein
VCEFIGSGVSAFTPKCRRRAFSAMVEGSIWLKGTRLDGVDARSADRVEKRLVARREDESSICIISL